MAAAQARHRGGAGRPGAGDRESPAGGDQHGAGGQRVGGHPAGAGGGHGRYLQLSYATIVAPIDGIVTKKTIQLGQIVQPGQSLMTIVPLSDVWVTANFKETQLADVRPGQRAEIHVDITAGRSRDTSTDRRARPARS